MNEKAGHFLRRTDWGSYLYVLDNRHVKCHKNSTTVGYTLQSVLLHEGYPPRMRTTRYVRTAVETCALSLQASTSRCVLGSAVVLHSA